MKLFAKLGALVAISALLASAAVASPDKDKDKGKKAAAAAKCPACKMDLATKKDKDHPTAVKIGKKTYYCCAQCDMGHKGKKK